jgi:Tfp pilus assembly protein PilP
MRNKIFIAYILFFCFLCLSSSSLAQERNSEQDSEKEVKSLIRKDLLQIKRGDLKLPGRNIFTPQSRRMSEEVVQSFEISPDLRQEASSEVRDSSFSLNLRYIGYIDSGQKMVALIIFEGEAIAVQRGEKISEQCTVEEITTEKIEIIGPGGEKKQIPLEGES